MKFTHKLFAPFLLITFLSACKDSEGPALIVAGLDAPVEVVRDQWGINHIYAENQNDLFFAQGYLAAKDRLFQFEIWRRQATGTVAEILGEKELKRDIGTRLFKFRGNMNVEMNHYHPEGEEIITSYVDGVNAYISEIMQTPDSLPVEFKLMNIQPESWTPEVVISRHQGLLGNINDELGIGRAVARIGVDQVKKIEWFHPKDPDIKLDPAINGDLLSANILELYNAYRRYVRIAPEDLAMGGAEEDRDELSLYINDKLKHSYLNDTDVMGSNNWVIKGELMEDGYPVMANDPHRTIVAPSLRYMAHLVAPGWNVIGGGEPEIPGISIGHNEYGAWGLTVFETDGEDLYVYELNPDNLNQYKYQDSWVDMEIITETIKVKNTEDVIVELRYTRHGPVTMIDSANNVGYAVRCAWMEPGGSPYLASLRMNQARTWEEFREACNFSNIPGENMMWADIDGNIGWQAVGIAPIRRNFSGLVPVPGDGRYEWDGYLPIIEKPHASNPETGFLITANENVTPETYDKWDAIAFSWSDPFRGDRIEEVLSSGRKFNLEDMKSLQTDYMSLPARTLVPMISEIAFDNKMEEQAREWLQTWDFVLDRNSVEAGIYVEWETQIRREANMRFIPVEVRGSINLQLTRIITYLSSPNEMFGNDFETNRIDFLKKTFSIAINTLVEKFGNNMEDWVYGQPGYKHAVIYHPLSRAVNKEFQEKFNVGPAPRGGNGYTPGSTGNGLNQSSGASFRVIIPVGDWDNSLGINSPGQSGDPESPFYRNLFEMWANDEYFPMYYSKEKIESVMAEKYRLVPKN
jgi:penicillin amidase